jgi:hypothetical protein
MTLTSRLRSLCAYSSSALQTLTDTGLADVLMDSNTAVLSVAPESAFR